jgi:hypothetical protein
VAYETMCAVVITGSVIVVVIVVVVIVVVVVVVVVLVIANVVAVVAAISIVNCCVPQTNSQFRNIVKFSRYTIDLHRAIDLHRLQTKRKNV